MPSMLSSILVPQYLGMKKTCCQNIVAEYRFSKYSCIDITNIAR